MNTTDIIQKCKITFNIPLPLKNHFYKGEKNSFRKKWFCKGCENSFDLKPWKNYKNIPASNLTCPNCGSESVFHSTELFRALVDKKQKSELLNIIDKSTLFNKPF